jgi:hypothetical protein
MMMIGGIHPYWNFSLEIRTIGHCRHRNDNDSGDDDDDDVDIQGIQNILTCVEHLIRIIRILSNQDNPQKDNVGIMVIATITKQTTTIKRSTKSRRCRGVDWAIQNYWHSLYNNHHYILFHYRLSIAWLQVDTGRG